MPAPMPGRAVRGSSTGRPLMAALDLLGRRWALRILWELRAGPMGARALRTTCGDVSSSVLYDRLRELQSAGLVRQNSGLEYELSPLGAQLGDAIAPLSAWSDRWSRSQRARP